MQQPDVVTIDLDDTLMLTQQDYQQARAWFGDFVALRHDVDAETARTTQRECSHALLDEYQLSRHRFPTSMREALQELVDDPSAEALQRVEEIGWSAYKDVDVYQDRGFRAGGKELLDTAASVASSVVLLTAGDPVVQERKIAGLDLRTHVDSVCIVGMGMKDEVLREYGNQQVLHIGNSTSSDVEAAAAANVDCLYVPDGEWLSDDPDGADRYDGAGTCITVESPREAAECLRSL